MATSDWDPDQYHRFAAQRAQPFWDLVGQVDWATVDRAVDLGCGSGELTAAVAGRCGELLGIDSSPAMLDRAAGHERDGLRFVRGDIGVWVEPDSFDLVLANASLQWVPDHEPVIARWAASLRAGGQLAVQVPANADHPSHLTAAAVASTEPFLSAMGGAPPPDPVADNVLPPERYSSLLHELGFEDQVVRLQVYPHLLDSSRDVVEWVKGTSLTRFFSALPDELHRPFLAAYTDRLMAAIGDRRPYLYPFKRMSMWGRMTSDSG